MYNAKRLGSVFNFLSALRSSESNVNSSVSVIIFTTHTSSKTYTRCADIDLPAVSNNALYSSNTEIFKGHDPGTDIPKAIHYLFDKIEAEPEDAVKKCIFITDALCSFTSDQFVELENRRKKLWNFIGTFVLLRDGDLNVATTTEAHLSAIFKTKFAPSTMLSDEDIKYLVGVSEKDVSSVSHISKKLKHEIAENKHLLNHAEEALKDATQSVEDLYQKAKDQLEKFSLLIAKASVEVAQLYKNTNQHNYEQTVHELGKLHKEITENVTEVDKFIEKFQHIDDDTKLKELIAFNDKLQNISSSLSTLEDIKKTFGITLKATILPESVSKLVESFSSSVDSVVAIVWSQITGQDWKGGFSDWIQKYLVAENNSQPMKALLKKEKLRMNRLLKEIEDKIGDIKLVYD